MRLDYRIPIEKIDIPRFSVEAVEGIGKLFTLTTLVLNVLDSKDCVEIVFHGLNPEDPERKIAAFREIAGSCQSARRLNIEKGQGGSVPGSSSYYRWIRVGH